MRQRPPEGRESQEQPRVVGGGPGAAQEPEGGEQEGEEEGWERSAWLELGLERASQRQLPNAMALGGRPAETSVGKRQNADA